MIDPSPMLTCECYRQVPESLRFEEAHLQERDYQRTDEFWDRFCSEPFRHVVGFQQDRAVGRVRLYNRDIRHAGVAIKLGGIGFVATDPAYRRRGIATQLLSVAMEQLRAEECEVGFLVTNIATEYLVKLYGKFGFVLLDKCYQYRTRSGRLVIAGQGGLVAPLTSPDKWHAILECNDVLDLGVGLW